MKNRTRIMIMAGILAVCLATGLFLCGDGAQTHRASLLISSSHTQLSYGNALDRLAVLSESLDDVIQPDLPVFEQASFAMLSISLYSLTLSAQEPLDEKQVQALADRLLQAYDRKVRQAYEAAAAVSEDRHDRNLQTILFESNRGDLTVWYEPLPSIRNRRGRVACLIVWLAAGLTGCALFLLADAWRHPMGIEP